MHVGWVEIAILSQYMHAVNRSSGKCYTFRFDGPWRVYNTSHC